MSLESSGILESLPAILEASSEAIASLDAEGRIRGFNSRFQLLLGLDDAELKKHNFADFFSNVDNERFNTDTRIDFQVALLNRPDGSSSWVLAKIIPVGARQLGYKTLIVQEPEAVRRIIDRLDYVENYDALTDLLNRRKGLLEFEHMQLGGSSGGCFLVNVHQLYEDQPMHDFLRQVAAHFRVINAPGILSRYSETEVLFAYSSETPLEMSVFNKLIDTLRNDDLLSGIPIEMAHSSWLAGTLTVNSLLDELKASMMPLNSPELIDSLARDASSSTKASFISKLFNALENQELDFYIQPQVSSVTGQTIGGELLVRWINPKGTVIPPSQFVDFLEEGEFAYHFYKWSIQKTIDTLKLVKQRTGDWLPLSLNLATPHLNDRELMAMLVSMVKKHAIPAGVLEVEITERILADDPDNVLANLDYLSENGIKIAIDDFGTGYSSLSYLRRFPLDRLKVDRVFVTNLEFNEEDRLIANSIVSLAHVLGLEVIAEGVEEAFQQKFLRGIGCEFFQGYLTGKPMSIADFIERVTQEIPLAEDDDESRETRSRDEDGLKLIKWKKSFSTDVVSVDNEHRLLVDALNDLTEAYKADPSQVDVLATIDLLASEAIKHFDHEEDVMFNIGYPRYQVHREKHKWLVADIAKRRAEIAENPAAANFREILHYLKYWLMRHMISEDTQLHRYINRHQDELSRD